ncbi:MAG: hypothetical protein ABIQ99_00660 [Thermoflexales bacterium]
MAMEFDRHHLSGCGEVGDERLEHPDGAKPAVDEDERLAGDEDLEVHLEAVD